MPYVRRAEQLGFHEVWLVEDCFLHGAFTQAATALAATTSLHVGLGIIPAAARNVAFAAMEISTLAGLHPGRLTVGAGHGMPDWLRQAGAWPSSPLTLLDEYIRVLRGCSPGSTWTSMAATPGCAFARAEAGSAGHELVAYNLASVDDDPGVARSRARGPLAVIGEPDWAPHAAVLEFATDLVTLRNGTGSSSAFAAALPGCLGWTGWPSWGPRAPRGSRCGRCTAAAPTGWC